ncbi:MAG: hypothetical protein RMM58_09270 [Chloroflexota bacterium]|nr:hypothetical protein [Dehalococcoidia bacterium]MDW8254056.1 hypothetical protein [Chloroflexota bacterium]
MARSKRRRPTVSRSLVPPRSRPGRLLRYLYVAILLGMVACLIASLLPQFAPA